MRTAYVIEVGEEQVGLVIREDGESDFQFHAAADAYLPLEGRHFANPYMAEREAIAHAIALRKRRPLDRTHIVGGAS